MLLLGSSSPRRAELLSQLGYQFVVKPADIDEAVLADEAADKYVERMSNTKFLAVSKSIGQEHSVAGLTADTVVVIDSDVLGKPENHDHASDMLQQLSGREHKVLTSVTIGVNNHRYEQFITETIVRFRTLSKQEISAYWDTGEPQDKAGAYAIQGFGAVFVESIVGSYSNVVGLPLCETARLLEQFGMPVFPALKSGLNT